MQQDQWMQQKGKIRKKRLHTYSRYTVYVNINIYTYKIYIYIYLFICVCVCLYDLAMPICIILDPLDPLIHIEGGGGRARAGAPAGAALEGGTGQSSPPVPEGSSAPPQPPGLHGPERPPSAGSAGRAAKLGRGVRLGPGISTTHII